MYFRKVKEGELSTNIWQSFANGDDAAYEQMYKNNVDALFDYGMKLVGEKTIVEDCIHELFIELWRKRKTLQISTSVPHYLLTSIRRKIFRYIKKSGRHNELHREVYKNDLHFHEMDAQEKRIDKEMVAEQNYKLKKAILALSRRQHEVISLRFFNELSYEEISNIMGISPNATYNLVSKAISTLRKAMVSLAWFVIFCLHF